MRASKRSQNRYKNPHSPRVHQQGLEGTKRVTVKFDSSQFEQAIVNFCTGVRTAFQPIIDAIAEIARSDTMRLLLESARHQAEQDRQRAAIEALGIGRRPLTQRDVYDAFGLADLDLPPVLPIQRMAPGRAMFRPTPEADWQDLNARQFEFPLSGMTLEPLSNDRVLGRWLDTDDDFGYSEDQYVHDDDPAPRTELCWKSSGHYNDACNKAADPESPSGLCTEHMIEMRGRWSDND